MKGRVDVETTEVGQLSEQWYRDDFDYSVWVLRILPVWVKCDNADERKEPWSLLEEGRDSMHLLLRLDDHARK